MNTPQLTTADIETIRAAEKTRACVSGHVDSTFAQLFQECAQKAIAGLPLGERGRTFVSNLRRFSDAPMTAGIWALGESNEHPVGTIRYEVRTGRVSERCVYSAHRTLHACWESFKKLSREDNVMQAWIVVRGAREDLVSIGMRPSHYDTLVVHVDGRDLECEVRP